MAGLAKSNGRKIEGGNLKMKKKLVLSFVLALALTMVAGIAAYATTVTMPDRADGDLLVIDVVPTAGMTVSATFEPPIGGSAFDGRFEFVVRLTGAPWDTELYLDAWNFGGGTGGALTITHTFSAADFEGETPLWIGLSFNTWAGTAPTGFTLTAATIDGEPVDLSTIQRRRPGQNADLDITGLVFDPTLDEIAAYRAYRAWLVYDAYRAYSAYNAYRAYNAYTSWLAVREYLEYRAWQDWLGGRTAEEAAAYWAAWEAYQAYVSWLRYTPEGQAVAAGAGD